MNRGEYMTNKRVFKGKSLLIFPADYTVIDIEINGFYPYESEIIEISALKVRNNASVETFSKLIKPKRRITGFITSLTGITNEMVKDASGIEEAIIEFEKFIGSDILLGYNVNFDVNFLYDNMMAYIGRPLSNDFVDVLRFSRKALPQLKSRSQTNVAEYFGISTKGAHRALNDCLICNECYKKLKELLYR